MFLKGIRRLIESLPLLKEKIHYKPVLTALQNIIEQTKKKAEAKNVCIELEEKIQELLETKEDDKMADKDLMPPPSIVPRNKKNVRRSRRKSTSDEDEDDSSDDSEEDVDNVPIKSKCKIDLVFFIYYVCLCNYKHTCTNIQTHIICYIT